MEAIKPSAHSRFSHLKRVGKTGLTNKVCKGEDEGVSAREEPRDRRQGGEIYDKKKDREGNKRTDEWEKKERI